MISIPLQIKSLLGIETSLNDAMCVCDFGEKFSGVISGIKIHLIHSNLLMGGCIDQKMTTFYRTIKYHAANAVPLTALLKNSLREQLIVRTVCQAFERIGLGGYKGKLVLPCHCLSVGKQSVESRSTKLFVVGYSNWNLVGDPQDPLL